LYSLCDDCFPCSYNLHLRQPLFSSDWNYPRQAFTWSLGCFNQGMIKRAAIMVAFLLWAKMTSLRDFPQPFSRPFSRPFSIVKRASWYGNKDNGKETASGEKFNERAMTAAHRQLPFGSRIRVTNLVNRRSLSLRINDRGPFVVGRDLDVSHAAAKRLGFEHEGIAPVEIQVLRYGKDGRS